MTFVLSRLNSTFHMASARLQSFDRQFRDIAVPHLATFGFTHGEDRTFRRAVEHEGMRSTQIVEFQVGREGWSIGRFTINLAVFNREFQASPSPTDDARVRSRECLSDLVQRLGLLRTANPTLIDRFFLRRPVVADHWWRQLEDMRAMEREMDDVMRLLLTARLSWFNGRTSRVALEWALRQYRRRAGFMVDQRPNGIYPQFEPEPFPESSG